MPILLAVRGRHLTAFAGALALVATQAIAGDGDANAPSKPSPSRMDRGKDVKAPAKALPAKKNEDAALRPKRFDEMTPKEQLEAKRRAVDRSWMDRTGDFW